MRKKAYRKKYLILSQTACFNFIFAYQFCDTRISLADSNHTSGRLNHTSERGQVHYQFC